VAVKDTSVHKRMGSCESQMWYSLEAATANRATLTYGSVCGLWTTHLNPISQNPHNAMP